MATHLIFLLSVCSQLKPGIALSVVSYLLAAYLGVWHFRQCGRETICIYTDHKPLTHSFNAKPDRYFPREIHLDYISQYTTYIRHISGKANTVADALSRLGVNTLTMSSTIDFREISKVQKEDVQFKSIPLPTSDGNIICDVSTGTARPYIPKAFR